MPLAAPGPGPGAVPVGFLLAGTALLLSAVLPQILHRWALSPAMVFLAAGAVASQVPGTPTFDPREHVELVEHVTEVCVLVALMGVGLALDRPVGLRRWASTWRLLAVGMPLTIAAVGAAGWWALGLSGPAALLLGAALAPTDPVLASDVRVGEPTDDPSSEDELRFAPSSEAGLNDGLAMPFAWAAVLLAGTAAHVGTRVPVGDLVLGGARGVVLGVACGWLFVGQLERLLTMALLLALGLALPTLLAGSLTWPVAAVAVGAVLVVRPLAAGLAMVGSGVADADRRSIAFFGVRGIGSFYYLAFGLAGLRADPAADTLWAVVAMTVVVSVVVHGASGSVVLRRLDRQAGRPTPEPA